MIIAIITQPLISNYGGLLQNWALHKFLNKEFNADVITFDQIDSIAAWYLRLGAWCKHKLFGTHNIYIPNSFDEFRINNICATPKARYYRDFRHFEKQYRPDVYIVGSDQVWRPRMIHDLRANFLGFTRCKNKIAYAASFGVNTWEFNHNQTNIAKRLVSEFSAISVREVDGIRLCKEYMGVDGVKHVLDPTLLITNEEYKLLFKDITPSKEPYIFSYILDSSTLKQKTVMAVLKSKGLKEFNAANDCNGVIRNPKLSVEEWLCGIANSEMVICDSFHGIAFSIVFGKNFAVLGNPERGNSRIESILTMLELNSRLVSSPDEAVNLPDIEYGKVYSILDNMRAQSLNFLKSALCNL